MKGGNVFQSLDKQRIAKSAFDLSHEHKTTFDMGQLIPILTMELIPGDSIRIGAAAVLRMQPMLAPILHQVKLRYYSFFVPYRILDDNWEDFITGGEDGQTVGTLPLFDPESFTATATDVMAVGSLWDYLGYNPVGGASSVPTANCPIDYPRRAYVKIWNEYFRIPGIQDEKPEGYGVANEVYRPLYRNWTRDYYTSALPFQQRGSAVSLPIFGSTNADFSGMPYANLSPVSYTNTRWTGIDKTNPVGMGALTQDAGLNVIGDNNSGIVDDYMALLTDNNVISGANLSSVDIADLRLAWQTQVYLERNARGGARYTEVLQFRYGTKPLDARLQRPEYLGGYTSPFLFSEVLQTSSTDTEPTPQGNMAGHGISVASSQIGGCRAEEHGLLMVIACADPTPTYQQGIDRSWLRRTKLEFPAPEFVHLSEQEIFNAEIYTQPLSADPTGSIGREPFGFTGQYNEMRYIPNRVSSEMRDLFDYWHLGRKFSALPVLNTDFVNMSGDIAELKRIYAVPSVPGIIGSFGLRINAVRPLPYMAVPSGIGGQ